MTILVLAGALAAWGEEPASPEVPEIRVEVGDGVWIDWTNLALVAESAARGYGVGAGRKSVEQEARRRLGPGMLAGAEKIPLTAELTLADLAEQPEVDAAVRSRLAHWYETETRYYTSGKVGLTGELSLQELLKPWILARAGAPAEGEQPSYTGLVIDARGHEVTPCYAPRLLDGAGEVLWEAGLWEEQALTEVPVVWVAEPSHPAAARAGAEPMLLRAAGARGADLVLAPEDVVRFRTGLRGARVLGEGRVAVVVDP